jgi:hypothetical protein
MENAGSVSATMVCSLYFNILFVFSFSYIIYVLIQYNF